MKLRTALTIAIAAVALAASANAQNGNGMRMDIPFAFLAGNEVLPAGSYTVRVDDGFNRILLEPQTNGPVRAVPVASGITERKQSDAWLGVLRFQKYGERWVLRAAFRPGRADGYYVMPSKAEKELARISPPSETAGISELH